MPNKPALIARTCLAIALFASLSGCAAHQATSPPTTTPPVSPAPSPPGPSLVVEVTADNFDTEVASAKLPVFIEFYATWCSVCQKEAPLIEQAAHDYAGKVKFVKIDIETSTELARAFGVSRIPTMLVVKVAEKTGVGYVGPLNQDGLKKLIEDGLKAKPDPEDK